MSFGPILLACVLASGAAQAAEKGKRENGEGKRENGEGKREHSLSKVTLGEGDVVEVVHDAQVTGGRVAGASSDVLELRTPAGGVRLSVASIQRVDRLGDSAADGSAIGAGVGGGLTLALMAKLCF